MSWREIVPVLFVIVQSSQQFSIISELISGLLGPAEHIMLIWPVWDTYLVPVAIRGGAQYGYLGDDLSLSLGLQEDWSQKYFTPSTSINIFNGNYHLPGVKAWNVNFYEYFSLKWVSIPLLYIESVHGWLSPCQSGKEGVSII